MKKVVIGLLIMCVLCALFAIIQPLRFIDFQKMLVPSDEKIVSHEFDRKLPGYSNIRIIKASGEGTSFSDPRLILVKADIESGEKPTTCEGEAFLFIGDPGNAGFFWQTLECEGLSNLVGFAQNIISSPYDPNTVWHPLYLDCYQKPIASVLFYWVKQGKIEISQIGWPKIKSLVEDMISGKQQAIPQPMLFDVNQRKIIDLAPQLPEVQKVKQYYMRCDGYLYEYRAESNLDIMDMVKSEDQFEIKSPISDAADKWKVK